MNSLKNISNSELVSRLERLARTERKLTHLILQHIAEIEQRKLYADLGFDGMYSYLTKGLGYSDGSAYRRLQSARLLFKIPELAEKLQEGKLNLSQLTQVQRGLREQIRSAKTIVNEENTQTSRVDIFQVLQKIENKNTFETQKILACEMNIAPVTHEEVYPQKDESVRLEITLSQVQFVQLQQAKELLSHICPNGTWGEIIATLAQQFNQKKLGRPKEKKLGNSAERQKLNKQELEKQKLNKQELKKQKLKKQELNKQVLNKQEPLLPPLTSTQEVVARRMGRRYLSIQAKRFLLRRAKHCCEYKDKKSGTKCASKYQLQVDHVRPLALGGEDSLSNLRILCRTHNVLMARRAGLESDQMPLKGNGT